MMRAQETPLEKALNNVAHGPQAAEVMRLEKEVEKDILEGLKKKIKGDPFTSAIKKDQQDVEKQAKLQEETQGRAFQLHMARQRERSAKIRLKIKKTCFEN